MKKALLLIIVTLLSGRVLLMAQDIYTYSSVTSGSPDYVDPLIPVYSGLTAIGASSTTACGMGFSGIDGWPLSTTFTGADTCIQVTLTASTGHSIKATGFSAGLRRSTTGPALARLAYSTDGITWITDGVDHAPASGSCATSTSGTTLASWSSFCVTGATLYFRIYPFHASGSGGTIQVYGLDIVGSVISSSLLDTPAVTASGPTAFCPGDNVTLSTAAGTGLTYQWYNGATAIAGATSSDYTATTSGDYYVELTSSASCTDTSFHTAVTLYPAPATTFSTSGPLSFCVPGSVTLTETSGTATLYQWYNASGPIAGATNATYTASTTDRDSLISVNAYGCGDTAAAFAVSASVPPSTVVLPAGPIAFCAGSAAVLTAPAGAGYTYQWYNAGVAISGATASTYGATIAGDYDVDITSGIGCSAVSNTVTASINPSPAPLVITSGPSTFCMPGSVTLTETSGTGLFYQWYNTSGAIASATSSTYIASATGRDSVLITNSFGCSRVSAATVVTANITPVAAITPSGSLAICSGSSSLLSVGTGAGYSYQWYAGTSAIPGATASTHLVSAAGNYLVSVSGAGGCSSTSAVVTVSINPLPVTTASASGPLNFCPGDSVNFTATAGLGYSFQWYNSSGAIAGATNIMYQAVNGGAYYAVVTNSYGCTASTGSFTVSLYPVPAPSITYSGPLSFCPGGNVVIFASAGSGYTYQWYSGGGAITGATGNSYTATGSGDDYAIITTANGCTTTSNSSHVVEIAVPYISAGGITKFCSGGNVIISASTAGASGISYQWMKDSTIIPGATSSGYVVNVSGRYSCLVTISSSCFSVTNNIDVIVTPTPVPVISFNGYELSTSPDYSTYQWYINTITIPGATSYTEIPAETGSFRVAVTDTNGCRGVSNGFSVFALGINNITAVTAPTIYPNPAKEVLHITYNSDVHTIISSINGKIIVNNAHGHDIDISFLAPGVYIVTLYNSLGDKVLDEKLVKE